MVTFLLVFWNPCWGEWRGRRVKAGVHCKWLRQTPLLFAVSGCVCEPYACLIFTGGNIPFNFLFAPRAQVFREHGVLTLPRLSAAERRLYIVTYSFLSVFLHCYLATLPRRGRRVYWFLPDPRCLYYRRSMVFSSQEFRRGEGLG